MRIGIISRFGTDPIRFSFDGSIVDAKLWSLSEIAWKWCDTPEYRLQFPIFSMGRKPVWNIVSGGRTIATGRLKQPGFRDTIFRAKLPRTEWSIGEEIVSVEPSYCSGVIRRADHVRLAVWRRRCYRQRAAEVVCRPVLPLTLVSIIAGLVLAQVFDPANNGIC
jgi:hypothetical protein